MGLSTALNAAVLGLRFNQTQTEVISGNVSNAGTVGYTRKTVSGIATLDGSGNTTGVRAGQIQRQLDLEVQRQLREAVPGSTYADHTADIAARLDALYGGPGDPGSLDALFNDFSQVLQELSSSPEDPTLRNAVLSDAQVLAGKINSVSDGIQDIRDEQETAIGNTVDRINDLLTDIAELNQQVVALANTGGAGAGALDARDQALDELATLIDIEVSERTDRSITVRTTSGYTLFDVEPAQLNFDGSGTAPPGSVYDPDPTLRGVGTVELVTIGGSRIDLIAQGAITSGLLGSQINARDDILVEAQAQIDTFAETLALSLSNETVTGTATTVGVADGFDLDLTRLQAGNAATLEYTNGGVPATISFIRVDSAATLPLDNTATANPNDTVVGLDFSGGFASVVTQIQTALGGSFTVSDQGGNVVRVLDDGAAATIDIQSFSASVTTTSLSDEGLGLPFFTDGVANQIYTGELDNLPQKAGFASRIGVNQDLLADSSALIAYSTAPATENGDGSRPTELYARLTGSTQDFAAGVGFGSATQPFNGTLPDFLTQTIARRASEAEIAQQFADGQSIVTNNLQVRLTESSAVNIDQELGLLIEVQNAYAANARVIQVVEEMLDALLRS
ncbi:MAG: flagellar hook-associated protein FlgK [Pseudomonadota bacterium]